MPRPVTRYAEPRYRNQRICHVGGRRENEDYAAKAAAGGLREIRLIVPDARSKAVRDEVAAQVARLDPRHEDDAVAWIEAVSEFDNDPERG